MFLHTFHPSPALAVFGPFVLRWYGLLLALAALVGYLLVQRLARAYRLDADRVTTVATLTVLFGFLGARLYHVLNEPAYYLAHPAEILQVWHGGLAIHGGIFAGALTVYMAARRWRLPYLRLTDLFAPALLAGQAIGRWGNYFNQELFGRPTNLPWGIPIDAAARPPGALDAAYFHPTFLYEFLWDGAGALALLWWHRQRIRQAPERRAPDGRITLVYLAIAASGRILTETLRIDQVPLLFGIRLPLLVSVLLLLAALVCLWYTARMHTTRPGRTPPHA